MATERLAKGFNKKRLRRLLAIIFVALAVPTVALIWQAYSQLKWQSFHQHRDMAASLTARIDSRLIDLITAADSQTYADYSFLVLTGDPSANFLQRSSLSFFPVQADLPGVVGYFQVDNNGEFSTPLLPAASADPGQFGINADELMRRQEIAADIQQILADNHLVQSRPVAGVRPTIEPALTATPRIDEAKAVADSVDHDGRANQMSSPATQPASTSEQTEEVMRQRESDAPDQERDGIAAITDRMTIANEAEVSATTRSYSQDVFDDLNQPTRPNPGEARTVGASSIDENSPALSELQQRDNSIGKLSDIKLDEQLQKKSESAAQRSPAKALLAGSGEESPVRSKRREQTTLPESDGLVVSQRTPTTGIAPDLRIDTFESELDPFEFSLLDSGHFVLFRKVWRNGERLIQGMLLDQTPFLETLIDEDFHDAALFNMSSLIIAYQDDVIHTISGGENYQFGSNPAALDGELLYRSRLSAPLDRLELIYSIRSLPVGPGANVVLWVTFVLALVFVGGFTALYRLGLSQIRLAQQQQDFVSAVSHELKTPLTSIRMYGEMLKEGWADEEKRQSYYEFIHDESERLTRMISNVLQLAKISKHEPVFDLKPTSVDTLMAESKRKLSGHVQRSGFDLNISTARDIEHISIDIDADCFTQIVINLIDNAIKFCGNAEQKIIEFTCTSSAGGMIVFAVRDYGPGIPSNQLKKIFRMFYRSENELTRETIGTGIGLAIVHQLTTGMNGKVDVTNQFPGVEFRISFPTSNV